MTEDELAEQVRQYAELKKQNKDVDVAGLALKALQTHEASLLDSKEKRIAYFISIVLPPFGLIYAVKFFLSDKSDAKFAAWMCIGLTLLSIVLTLVILNGMISSSGVTLDQFQQAPQQYQDLLQ